MAREWYNWIISLFASELVQEHVHASPLQSVEMRHNGQRLRNRYIVAYPGYLALFREKAHFEAVDRMQFFDEGIFRDFLKKQQCVLVPLATGLVSARPGNAFVVSDVQGDRKWLFGLHSKQSLSEWMRVLTASK